MRSLREAVPGLLVLGWYFGTFGFALGTFTLLGPVRWLTTLARSRGWSQGAEDWSVRIVILLLIVVTFFIARAATRATLRQPTLARRIGLGALGGVLMGGALVLWLNPRLMNRPAAAELNTTDRFVFGPYPTEPDLARLKAEGYSGVISLLHPAVAPFEPKLLNEEKAAAARVGITLVHAPMLPWVSENEASLNRIRELASTKDGRRYYVHCYLGKDRVNVVRRLIEQVEGRSGGTGGKRARQLWEAPKFERGPILAVDTLVTVIPFPTDDEWFGYILAGQVKTILSLLDPADPGDAKWIERQRQATEPLGIEVVSSPVPVFPFEPEKALAAARLAHRLPKPLVAYAFRSESVPAEGFIIAYRTDLPPLPPRLFREPMEAGPVRIEGPNVAVGDRPTGREWGAWLWRRGIRSVLFAGDPTTAEAVHDREIAEEVGMRWHTAAPGDTEAARLLLGGGPWYVYGPGAARLVPPRRIDR